MRFGTLVLCTHLLCHWDLLVSKYVLSSAVGALYGGGGSRTEALLVGLRVRGDGEIISLWIRGCHVVDPEVTWVMTIACQPPHGG